MSKKCFSVFVAGSIFIFALSPLQAQDSLEARVSALERYVQAIEPSLGKFANDLEYSMQNYTKQLESGLESYTVKLQENLEQQIQSVGDEVVVLDLASKVFQKIETNVGAFLVYTDKISKIDNGYRIHLYIGNLYAANFKDFKLILTWGKKRAAKSVVPYESWRNSLKTAEYTFKGSLKSGKWNYLEVNISPAEVAEIGYVECRMHISSAELQFDK